MVAHRQNITVDPIVYEEFCRYAKMKGMKISTWVAMKMKEAVEEEKELKIGNNL
ncbi:hypothetical protein KPL47_09675 [Clostridium estertheticum]|uniref:hypothetical protein n=1 Tax=Clostridium estertheticum TaxID=238834 RepID=UPI001C0CE248|nr:hypothetical protein [Clostridium estertheticum]MBU3176644.1 hypothetical protein [Clostridium estertheticum]